MFEQLDKILELIQAVAALLGSPAILAIIGFVYHKITKKKADEEKIRHFFNNILTSVKTVEKELGLDKNNISKSKLDPRMDKALKLFDKMKKEPVIEKATKSLKINISDLSNDEIKDLLEKLLHAKKIAMDFDIVKELENKTNGQK